jgi:hypothetical protein
MAGQKSDEHSPRVNRVNERSASWAQARAAKETGAYKAFWTFIADGLAENIGIREMIARFAAKGFQRSDAERLVRTAVATANETSQLEEAIRINDEGKLKILKGWSTAKDGQVCEACRANEAQGWIGLRERFQSGHMCGPAHIGCRCYLLVKASEGN